jgi:DNA repair exonuclease SbcCD nuclease subunit
MSCRIAFFADAHVGYKTKVRSNAQGINIRAQDGYNALREVVAQIIKANEEELIDCVVIAGDLFHASKPSMRDIVTVQHYLRELSKRNIKVVILAGNHDATDARAELAAIAPINDPDKGIHAFIDPYKQHEIADGVMLHIVSHHGLSSSESPDVQPKEGYFNVFTTHGAALDPKNQELMRCAESIREQFIPVEMIIDDSFTAKLLGHYHSRYPVGGESLNTWYSGSLVRRGFSDAAGARGWMMVTIDDNGQSTFKAHDIKQRPQYDLDVIDADGKTASQVMDLLEISLNRTKEAEQEPIVRQRIINTNRGIRTSLDASKINELSAHMLSWQLEFPKSDRIEKDKVSSKNELSLGNKHSVNILSSYKDWITNVAKSVPEEYRDTVVKDAEEYIREARDKGFEEGHSH